MIESVPGARTPETWLPIPAMGFTKAMTTNDSPAHKRRATATSTDTDDKPTDTPSDQLAPLTAFQRDILWAIGTHDTLKGIAIKHRLEGYYGDHVNNGRLYPNLDELVAANLLTKSERDGRTNEYELTADGKQALTSRREWTTTEAQS